MYHFRVYLSSTESLEVGLLKVIKVMRTMACFITATIDSSVIYVVILGVVIFIYLYF
jgi:hypothetical protein